MSNFVFYFTEQEQQSTISLHLDCCVYLFERVLVSDELHTC